MTSGLPSFFHLHLVSDSTGETLTTIAKAASVQYASCGRSSTCIRCAHARQMKRVLQEIEQTPGIVLYTITNKRADARSSSALRGAEDAVPRRAAADHAGVRELSRRAADADGGRPARARRRLLPPHRRAELHHGARRRPSARQTSTTPTSSCSASRARRRRRPASIWRSAATRPRTCRWCPSSRCRKSLTKPHTAFVVCLIASPDRIAEVRRNRVGCSPTATSTTTSTAPHHGGDRLLAQDCAQNGWPVDRRDAPLGGRDGCDHLRSCLHDRQAGRQDREDRQMAELEPPTARPGIGSRARRRDAGGGRRPLHGAGARTSTSRRSASAARGEDGGIPPQIAHVLARAKARGRERTRPEAHSSSAPTRCWRWAEAVQQARGIDAARASDFANCAGVRTSCTRRWRCRGRQGRVGACRHRAADACAISPTRSSSDTSRAPAIASASRSAPTSSKASGVQLFDDRGRLLHHPRPAAAAAAGGAARARDDRDMNATCVIGWPIEHSRSPLIHGYWLQAVRHRRHLYEGGGAARGGHAIPALPRAERVSSAATSPCRTRRRRSRPPMKRTPPRSRSRRRNTLWVEGGKLHAANTDTYGFMTYLEERAPGWDANGPAGVDPWRGRCGTRDHPRLPRGRCAGGARVQPHARPRRGAG